MNAILEHNRIRESDYCEFHKLRKGRIDNHKFGTRLITLPNYKQAYRALLAL